MGGARPRNLLVRQLAPPGADYHAHERQALRAADRAVALGPELADAYAARGLIRTTAPFSHEAAEDIARALALQPGNADAHVAHAAWVLIPFCRYDEAIAVLRRAIDVDPLLPDAWFFLGASHAERGELAEARAALTRATELAPGSEYPRHALLVTELLAGRPTEARRHLDALPPGVLRGLGEALVRHALGERDAARRILDRVAAEAGEVAAFQIAEVHAFWGDRERAFEWLERAFAQHDGGLLSLRSSRLLSSVRGDPRYEALVRRMGLDGG